MQLAADPEILALTRQLDRFQYRARSEPFINGRSVASGISYLDGIGHAYIHQAMTYRKIWLQRRESERPTKPLIQIDQHAGLLEFEGPSLLDDADFADEIGLGSTPSRPIVIANVRPSGGETDYFNERYSYLPSPNSMAFMDIVIREYESGAPVFYGLLPRPDKTLVLDITQCLTKGEVLDGAGIDGTLNWRRFLLDPEG
jgi:hypothetical protein